LVQWSPLLHIALWVVASRSALRCSMDGPDEELEYTLFNKRDVMVYQIPPASSSAGHKADDWKKCIWMGRCRIVGKGKDLAVKMLDSSSGQLFAQCQIPNGEHDKYVERVLDSSRYFVLKITNGARHAFIGLGFEDRNDAFDFNCALCDFKSTFVDKSEDGPGGDLASQEPAKDLSLKEGQKITVNIPGMEERAARRREQQASPAGGGGFGGLLAPPPPSSGQSRRQSGGAQGVQPVLAPPSAAPPAAAVASGAQAAVLQDFASFGDFDDFQSAGASPPAAQSTAAVSPPASATADVTAQFGQLGLGGGSGPQVQDQAVSKPPQKQGPKGGGGPFDEFDIFK